MTMPNTIREHKPCAVNVVRENHVATRSTMSWVSLSPEIRRMIMKEVLQSLTPESIKIAVDAFDNQGPGIVSAVWSTIAFADTPGIHIRDLSALRRADHDLAHHDLYPALKNHETYLQRQLQSSYRSLPVASIWTIRDCLHSQLRHEWLKDMCDDVAIILSRLDMQKVRYWALLILKRLH